MNRQATTYHPGNVEPVVADARPGIRRADELHRHHQPEESTDAIEDGRVLKAEAEIHIVVAAELGKRVVATTLGEKREQS